MPTVKTKSISRSVRMSRGQTFYSKGVVTTQILGPRVLEKERQLAEQTFNRNLAALSSTSKQAISDVHHEHSPMDADPNSAQVIEAIGGQEDSEQWVDVPLADEPESEAFMCAVREMVLDQSVRKRSIDDTRTQRQRRERMDSNWAPLMENIVTAFLQWKTSYASSSTPSEPPSDFTESPYMFDIDIIDIYGLEHTRRVYPTAGEDSVAIVLASRGFLGNTPLRPSRAISFRTLELFRRLRQRQPSFSCEAYSKVLCDLYEMPYHRGYRTTLADTFDLYVSILNAVEKMVKKALGQDSPDWRARHACPPCGYHLQDEPPLRFSRMYCVDGNNSLKRMASIGTRDVSDRRAYDSDYFLPREYVDRFAHEVKARQGAVETAAPAPANDNCDTVEAGDPTDGKSGDPALSGCVRNWKAAASDSSKKMWAVFEETGIFASACRHGLFLWIADMVRSGELAKYPLAVVAKVLEVLEPKTLLAYDIGCSFDSTIKSSSLGPEFERQQAKCIVNAFHGYSHGYSCQSQYHPNITAGAGLTDLEDLERSFSQSNRLATIVRYASLYRWRMFIDLHCKQYDEDKYANLASLIYNNYVQALTILEDDGASLHETMTKFNITEEDLANFSEEERDYVATLGQEEEYDIHAVVYVELLQEKAKLEDGFTTAQLRFLHTVPEDYAFTSVNRNFTAVDISETQKLETERRLHAARLADLNEQLTMTEVKMNITRRWQPSDVEYIEAAKYSSTRAYHRALDHLQKLVVQRLFELQKMNLAQTGYRMRTHIAKSLQTRCKAIQNAVKKYNDAAASLQPPRPPLDWSAVSQYSFLDEFTLLRETRTDIRARRWTQPIIREMMRQFRRIERAKEEVVRCNVEVRRLHTWVVDENKHMNLVVASLHARSDPCLVAAGEHCRRRRKINNNLLRRIDQIHSLPGFSGNATVGIRLESLHVWSGVVAEDAMEIVDESESTPDHDLGEDPHAGMDEDLIEAQATDLVDYLARISLD